MKLGVFSVVGEALNFGARRMETIMRVAWLPVVLILVLQMATVFTYLSVIGERIISFADVSTYTQAQRLLARYLEIGLETKPAQMAAVGLSSAAIEMILIASFMAPLIRLAGLGEQPAPGVVRLAFGPDQLRYIASSILSILVMAAFIFGPMAAAAFFTVKYILQAIAEIRYADFPNPESLHTINIITAQEVFFDMPDLWPLSTALPLAITALFLVGFWLLLVAHFHPKNRGGAAGRPANPALRAIFTLVGMGLFGGLVWAGLFNVLGAAGSGYEHILAIVALVLMIVYYAQLRITPYIGVAVCRRSLAPGPTLKVTRGFGIFHLLLALMMLGALLYCVQLLINSVAFPAIGATVNMLFQATDVYARFVSGGEGGGWVRPFFIALWNGLKILANIFWAFFAYGVSAGLLGRLYRESMRGDGAVEPPPWRRK